MTYSNLYHLYRNNQLKFSKQEEEKRPFYNELSFGLDDDNNVKTKG